MSHSPHKKNSISADHPHHIRNSSKIRQKPFSPHITSYRVHTLHHAYPFPRKRREDPTPAQYTSRTSLSILLYNLYYRTHTSSRTDERSWYSNFPKTPQHYPSHQMTQSSLKPFQPHIHPAILSRTYAVENNALPSRSSTSPALEAHADPTQKYVNNHTITITAPQTPITIFEFSHKQVSTANPSKSHTQRHIHWINYAMKTESSRCITISVHTKPWPQVKNNSHTTCHQPLYSLFALPTFSTLSQALHSHSHFQRILYFLSSTLSIYALRSTT